MKRIGQKGEGKGGEKGREGVEKGREVKRIGQKGEGKGGEKGREE